MGPFHPREPSPGGGGLEGGLRRLCIDTMTTPLMRTMTNLTIREAAELLQILVSKNEHKQVMELPL